MEKDLGKESPEFFIWKKGHLPFYDANYSGSSGAMEVEIAAILWKRSIDHSLRYTTILCDGDSRTFTHLKEIEVYGPEVNIEKECVKRMGIALRNLVSAEKKKKRNYTWRKKSWATKRCNHKEDN